MEAKPREVDITACDLGFAYGGPTAGHSVVLQHVNLAVGRGDMCCILGPSGCGKTTLLRMLAGELVPSSGNLAVDKTRLETGFAFIPQSAPLLPWRTILQNVTLGLEIQGPVGQGELEYVSSLLEQYGLAGSEHMKPSQLSGGMRQKTAVIRALARKPALLYCDEPFSAIDFVTRLSLTTRFKKLCRITGCTTVFVTHNIEEAIFLGDKIILLGGRPASVIASYEPRLSIHPEDAVECRQSPEFESLFRSIWRDLDACTNT